MTERFTLDHVIDLEQMQAALDRTAEIYPHLKDAFVKIGGETFYESGSAPLRVFVGEKVTAPGPGKAEGRPFTVTCHENTVSLSAFHSTFDMGGLTRLACTLLLQYCRIHFGGTYQIPGIPEPDGQEHPEYSADTFALSLGEFQESHGERPEGGTFQVPEFCADEDGRLQIAEILAPSGAFMKVCRDIGASPAILLFLLMAKAAYKAHPEQEGPITGMLTADIRKALGMVSLGPITAELYLSDSRRELEETPLRDTAKKCSRVLRSQRTVEYAMTAVAESRRTGFQSGVPFNFISTCMGHMELGDCGKHVTDFAGYNHSAQTIDLFELNGSYRFQVLLGRGTAAYTQAICEMLNDMGIDARISKAAAPLPPEARDART